jgi:hypothetical protein
MDKWPAALTAIGGLAGVGGLIDIAMYRAEKEKLKALLEDWWLRFTDVRWSNFGRVEAELAVQILDRWASSRLWSLKRWRFSAIVTFVVYLLVMLWTALKWALQDFQSFALFQVLALTVSFAVIWVPPSIAAFAISLSLTRYIAVSAARLCRGRLITGVTFTLLIFLHLVLLIYWSVLVIAAEMTPILGVLAILQSLGFHWVDFDAADMFKELVESFVRGYLVNPLHWAGGIWSDYWSNLFSWHRYEPFVVVSQLGFKVAMDIVANGLRILFALVFLSSFVFRPLIQEPVSRLWYGAMNSSRPTFTILFSAVGAMVAAVGWLS